jgi:outer membrane protein OmpA-like peptidoglycan-associated protein
MEDGVYSTDKINPSNFKEKLFEKVLINRVNMYLDSLGLEGFEQNEFFVSPAKAHAEYMVAKQDTKTDDFKSYLVDAGGTGVGAEVAGKITIKVSNEFLTYDEVASQLVSRWGAGKPQKILAGQKYFFAGVGAKIDEKKVFVAMFVGNYASITPIRVDGRSSDAASLTVPVTTKKYGLKPYDEKVCKKVSRKMPNVRDLQSGLSVNDNGEIVFKYNDLKKFKRFMKGSKDALAVDIVQPEQFACGNENIADYSRNNIGYMTKRVWSKKLYKNNIAPGEGRKNKVTKLEVVLGLFPTALNPADVEMNLMVIKEKSVCANIPRSYVDNKIYDFVPKIGLLPDTILASGMKEYSPKATKERLTFKIMFEQGKSDYKPEEMKDVIATLNEPDFFIDKIFIRAYSSLEGSRETNKQLQKKRAQSIVSALEKNQNASIVDSIVTAENLKDLQDAVRGTSFDKLCNMDMNSAISYVNSNQKKLEPYLKQTRYADITIDVTYDLRDAKKEQKYVLKQFNKAVEAKQLDLALSIQKYILKQVVAGRYDDQAVADMNIPEGADYVGLNMNKVWLTQFIYSDPLDEDYRDRVDELNRLDLANAYVDYNDVLCEVVVNDLTNESYVDKLQARIDKLYNTPINMDVVDMLNIELQYQVMDIYKDSCGYDHPTVIKCLEKMKEIIKFDKLNWENSLKFASIFINHSDYEYAIHLLEPWIEDERVPLVYISTYVTVCSKVEYKVHSNNFVKALERLKQMDPKYLCDLFKSDKLSTQTFVNTKAKKVYCETCAK